MQVFASGSLKQLERLAAAHREVMTHLSHRSSEDQAFEVRTTIFTEVYAKTDRVMVLRVLVN